MAQIEKVERIVRSILWLALAGLAVAIPLHLRLQAREAKRLSDEAATAAAQARAELAKKEQEEAKKPLRLSIKSMGPALQALDRATGMVWFSNASPREGVVCLTGVASKGQNQTVSLPSCERVEAYESNIKLSLMFAGGDLKRICPDGDCDFHATDTPLPAPETVAAAK